VQQCIELTDTKLSFAFFYKHLTFFIFFKMFEFSRFEICIRFAPSLNNDW
jgi:hypothetical protein